MIYDYHETDFKRFSENQLHTCKKCGVSGLEKYTLSSGKEVLLSFYGGVHRCKKEKKIEIIEESTTIESDKIGVL